MKYVGGRGSCEPWIPMKCLLCPHLCLFQACECHKCVLFSEHCSILPAESALKTMQELHLKRQLTQGLIKSGTTSPKAHSHVKKSSIQTGVLSECLWPGTDSEFGSQDALLIGQALEFLSLSWTPAPLKKQLTISLSRKSHRPPALPSREVWVPSSHPLTSFALQAPKTSDQDSDSASLEWQRKLEAAEALLTLRESSQAPSGPTPLLQPSAAPGKRGLQPPSRSLRPRPASSISLPIGHVGCISLLS
uniref:Doublesex- and mab-3-related transcription factor C1/C2 C-terminal domain-containing protein n=1 Tax=Sus scrofa TaxID=9823 RepID=A0A8W4FH06_PIG